MPNRKSDRKCVFTCMFEERTVSREKQKTATERWTRNRGQNGISQTRPTGELCIYIHTYIHYTYMIISSRCVVHERTKNVNKFVPLEKLIRNISWFKFRERKDMLELSKKSQVSKKDPKDVYKSKLSQYLNLGYLLPMILQTNSLVLPFI